MHPTLFLRALGATLVGLLASCATRLTQREFDDLARTLESRTVVFERALTLYSPYDPRTTHGYLDVIEAERASLFALFEVESAEPILVWLQPSADMGLDATLEGGQLRLRGISSSPADGILGHALGETIVVRVAPEQILAASDGRTLRTTPDPTTHRSTIRHELAHVATNLLGVSRRCWLTEGLAHAVQWIPIEDGRFQLDPMPESLQQAASLAPDARTFDEMLAWEQGFPPTDLDRRMRLLALSFVVFAVDRQQAPSLRERVLSVAALDDAGVRSLQAGWAAWLGSFAAADR